MISVIIPSYCSQSTIIECLQSLIIQRTEEDFELLVVNSSIDNTYQIVKKHFPAVSFIQLEKRAFAGTARNIGIKNAKGDILAFIDSDCTASADWLNRIESWHRKGYETVGGSIVNVSDRNIFSRAEYPLEILEFSPNGPMREITFVSAANCSFSRDIFDKYGLFPDIRAGEDVIFCQKIYNKHEKIIFDPDIKVFHKNDIGFMRYINKQIMHGFHSFQIRQMANLPGSFMNNSFTFPLLLPLLPMIRALRIIYRSAFLTRRLIYDILRTYPLFLLGCVMWSCGYAKGYTHHRAHKIGLRE